MHVLYVLCMSLCVMHVLYRMFNNKSLHKVTWLGLWQCTREARLSCVLCTVAIATLQVCRNVQCYICVCQNGKPSSLLQEVCSAVHL